MKSLKSLCKEQLSKNFETIPFFPEQRLNKVAATALFDELPISIAGSDAIAQYIFSETYFERACSQLSFLGYRCEEHGFSFKRMYYELKASQELLHAHENIPLATAEMIFSLKLSCAQDFPLDAVCSQLPNLNTLEIKYQASPQPHAALKVSPNLLTLSIQDSFLSDDDVAIMFGNDNCITYNIINLNLAHNNITSTGLGVIVKQFLASPETVLCSLNLMGNRIDIDNEGGSKLTNTMAGNESLLSLNLRLNEISDAGGQILIESLEENDTLEYLNLAGNVLSSRSAKALVKLLESQKSSSLVEVDITSNPFGDEDEELIKSCEQCLLDMRVGSLPGRQEMFLGKSLMPF